MLCLYYFSNKSRKSRKTNVETLILGGGPTINELFFCRDLVDEVNIVLFPCSGSGEDSTGILGKGKFVEFDLIEFKKFEGGSILLKYKKK